jgi:hypothetical protein
MSGRVVRPCAAALQPKVSEMNYRLLSTTALLCACSMAPGVPIDGSAQRDDDALPVSALRRDASAPDEIADLTDASTPLDAALGIDTDDTNDTTNTTNTTTPDAMQASGACLDETDLAVIAELGADALSCEGAACVARSLSLGAGIGIDDTNAAACMERDAPSLSKLSAACRECFVEVSLCVPRECVALLGGADACRGVPSSSFSACGEPPMVDARCAECQADPCYEAFASCSGVAR